MAILLFPTACSSSRQSVSSSSSTPSVSSSPILSLTSSNDDKLKLAPDIAGLTKEIQNNAVVYTAAEGNQYGLKAGQYSGYYATNIFFNGQQTGGVALLATIVESIISSNASQGNPGYIPIPVDPSEGQKISVEFNQSKIYGGQEWDLGYIYVSTDQPVNLVNLFSDKELIKINTSFGKDSPVLGALMTNNNFKSSISANDVLGNIRITVNQGTLSNISKLPTQSIINSNVGDIIGQFDQQILLTKRPYIAKTIEEVKITQANILTIDGSLVFEMANKEQKAAPPIFN